MKIPRPNKEQPVPGCGLVSVYFEMNEKEMMLTFFEIDIYKI
jgi:hypothetical protein